MDWCTSQFSEPPNCVKETQMRVNTQKHLPQMWSCRCARGRRCVSLELCECSSSSSSLGHSELEHQSAAPFWRAMNHLMEGPSLPQHRSGGGAAALFGFFYLLVDKYGHARGCFFRRTRSRSDGMEASVFLLCVR